ncbi:advillin-like [Littorina saxatilis]|uniref:advillin-like n=1 Tax=Littorina saxatilis TaxID=31220 RepID=UPI0038B5D035
MGDSGFHGVHVRAGSARVRREADMFGGGGGGGFVKMNMNGVGESGGGGGGGGSSEPARVRRKGFIGVSGVMPSSVSDVSRETSGVTSLQRHSVVSATSGYHSGVTSFAIGSSQNQLDYHKSRVTINDTMTSASSIASDGDVSSQSQDPFARVSVERPGLHVWRAEAGALVTLEQNDHGFFHEGACYLVLKVYGNRFTSLHYWLGQQASQNDAKTVERFFKDVDEMVHRASVLSREVQGHESDSFLRNFSNGVIYVEGKAKMTVTRASKYVKRLYVIKGRKFARAACREPREEELDSTGAALLDGFPRMYLWIGAHCDPVSRLKAMGVATKIRDGQRKGKAHIIVVEETDTHNHSALLKKLKNNDRKEREDTKKDTPNLPSEEESTPVLNLHRVSGDRVLYDMPFAATSPLLQRFLVTADSYLLDQGPTSPLCVWVGTKADNSDLSQAVSRGQSFAAHRRYPAWLPVCRITEGSEPPSFKKAFLEWRERVVEKSHLSRSYSVANIGRALFSRSDPRTVAKTSPLIDSDMTLSVEGETQTFRVDGDSLEPHLDQPGVFLNSDCYVIWHRPDIHSTSQPLPPNIFFYWLGSRSEESARSHCLRLCLTMACALEDAAVIRVLDDKEPQSLLSIFHNSMVVYDEDVLSTGTEATMYCVKECAQGSMRVQQVPAKSSYLNSSAAIILLTPARCVLWFGERTGGSEREFSKTMLGFLDSTRMYQYHVVIEGKEPDHIWDVLGPKAHYEKTFPQPPLQRRSARLSLCRCGEEGDVSFEELTDFCQQDLSDSEIFILDVFDQVMMWCGRSVEEETRKQLLPKYLKEYMSRDPAGREESDVLVWIVSHGSEPEAFRRYFPAWNPYLYGGEEAFTVARRRLRQENARIDAEDQIVDKTYLRVTRHPYKALLKSELPPDTLSDHREHHLSDKQFLEAVKMPRCDFYRLPGWKQAQILRSARLAHFPPVAPPRTTSNSISTFPANKTLRPKSAHSSLFNARRTRKSSR